MAYASIPTSTALNSYENRVYQFMDEDRRRYVVKFYRLGAGAPHKSVRNISSLWIWPAQIPAVAPLALQGATLHGGFFFALFPTWAAA